MDKPNADEFFDFLNELLPHNIKIEPVDDIENINTIVKGTCVYFKLIHPEGDCYCGLTPSHELVSILE